MRLSTALQIAGAAALVTTPTFAAAAPLRASAALPAKGAIRTTPIDRASTRGDRESQLIGFPIAVVIGLFASVALIVIIASDRGRSPG